MILPIPSGTRDVLPDEMRELHAIIDGCAPSSTPPATARSTTPGARVRVGARPRRARRRAARLPRVRRERRGPRAALRHDGADRARRRHALRRTPSCRCASPTSRTATARCGPQRGQPREFLQAGIELIGAAGPGGHRRGADGAVPRARPRRPRALPRRARRRVALPGAARRASASRRGARPPLLAELGRGDFVGARERAARARRSTTRSIELLLRVPAAARRAGRAARTRRARSPTPSPACATVHALLDADVAARVIFDLGLVARPGLLHAARCSRSTTRRSGCRSAAAAATTTCSASSGAICRPSASRSRSSSCTRRSPPRSAR